MTVILTEPFDSLANWTTIGTLVPGRTGTGLQLPGTNSAEWTVPTSEVRIVVDFWANVSALTTARSLLALLYTGLPQVGLRVETTGAVTVSSGNPTGGTVLGTSATGLITAGAYHHYRFDATLSDVNGAVAVTVNGTLVVNLTAIDTRLTPAADRFDQVSLRSSASGTHVFDDLTVEKFVVPIPARIFHLFAEAVVQGSPPARVHHAFAEAVLREPARAGAGMGSSAGDPTNVSDANDYELGTRFETMSALILPGAKIWNPGAVTRAGRSVKLWECDRTTWANPVKIRDVALPSQMPVGWSSWAWTPVVTSTAKGYLVSYDVGALTPDYGSAAGAFTVEHFHANNQLRTPPAAGRYNPTPDTFPTSDSLNASYGLDVLYAVTPVGATVKVWNGAAFVDGAVKVWNGSAWVDAAAVKTWNGSAWV